MDLLDRLLGHDAWTTRRLLTLAHPLGDSDLDRAFDVGPGTLRLTFEHVVRNMEVWTDLMNGASPREAGASNVEALIIRLDAAATDLARVARSVANRDGWDETWTETLEEPPVDRSYGGTIAHLVTHSMHHRAQLLYMLRRLGVKDVPEGDALSWENEARQR